MRLQRGRSHRRHHHQAGRAAAHVPERAAARPAPGPRARRRLGALRADRGRPDRPARAAQGAAQALHPVAGAAGWTTLSLTLHADGTAESAMTGASKFPRHWLYNDEGSLTHKSGLTDFSNWMAVSFGPHSPWGDEDSEA